MCLSVPACLVPNPQCMLSCHIFSSDDYTCSGCTYQIPRFVTPSADVDSVQALSDLGFGVVTYRMWSRGCICCSPATVQHECAQERLEQTSSRSGPISFVECLSCNGQVCGFCIDGLLRLIAESHKDISPSDHLLVALRGMKLALSSRMVSVQLGFCCTFMKSIHPDAHLTLTKPPRLPDLPSVMNQLDGDYDFCDRETFNKRIRHALNRPPVMQAENVDFLHQYFSGTSPPITMKPAEIPSILQKMNQSR